MELIRSRAHLLTTGFAIFSMFFGAGNIVFPLILGDYAQGHHLFGFFGMALTAVLIPLMGMLAIILYEGDYLKFFAQIGRVPGLIMITIILSILGPFGAVPRCITVAYSTFEAFGFGQIKGVNLISFSFVTVLIVYVCAVKQIRLLDLLGKVLTPLLLLSLAIIVVKGLWGLPQIGTSVESPLTIFSRGVLEGYNTMDLLASFFFSSVILVCLREQNRGESLMKTATGGAVIAAILLSLVYLSFMILAAGYHDRLEGVPKDELLGVMAGEILGPYAGLVVGVTVFLAVLTTKIALASIFAKFLQKELLHNKISYRLSLGLTLLVAFGVSTLQFDGIASLVTPALQLCYPALIALAFAGLVSKVTHFNLARPLFYGTLVITFLARL